MELEAPRLPIALWDSGDSVMGPTGSKTERGKAEMQK